MSTPDYFPVETRVVLKGLVNSPELNGKVGIVKSALTNGRQQVYIEELSKSVALKVSNLKFESRTVDTLSVKELKQILKAKANTPDAELTGLDKSELQSKVTALGDATPETIAQWLAESKKVPVRANAKPSPQMDPSQAAETIATMDPEQLRQQARMMRSMPPDTIRRMNPQLAHMSDAQILAAANQMEMMASNPEMMKMATEQIKKMSPEEIRQAQAQAAAGIPTPSTTTPSSGASPAMQADQAAQVLANMTPEQLRQQADMFESMSPDAIRQMNPQLATMTDEQIKMAAKQYRMMADNPEMMKMAMEQMKGLTPEQIEAIRKGEIPAGLDGTLDGQDPAEMLAKMDKKQLKGLLKTLKENPETMKQFAASSGLSEDQLAKGLEMFGDMDDAKLELTLNMIQRAQKVKDVWTKADAKTGGHLMKIIIFLVILVFWLVTQRLFFSSGSSAPVVSAAKKTIPTIPKETVPVVEDEFASEF